LVNIRTCHRRRCPWSLRDEQGRSRLDFDQAYLFANLEALNQTGAAFGADTTGYRPAIRILTDHAVAGVAAVRQLIDDGWRGRPQIVAR
jgi:hypothetical protein